MDNRISTTTLIEFPAATRPLPGPEDLARIMDLPIVQMFVVGRSGSTAVHAFLDGHPQILQLPQILQFYRLFGTGGWNRAPEAAIDWLLADHIVAWAMDSSLSLITRGSLGDEGNIVVRIRRDEFRRAFLALTGTTTPLTERSLFVAFHVAYGWCLGKDLGDVTMIMNHLHHGFWLFQQLLIQPSTEGVYRADPVQPLVADRYIVTVRNPVAAISTNRKYSVTAETDPRRSAELYELLLRWLVQDWIRLKVVSRGGNPVEIVKLEQLKSDTPAVIRNLAGRLGVQPDHPSLAQMSFFDLTWHGDVYSPRSTVLRPEPPAQESDADDIRFLHMLIGDIAHQYGYENECGVYSADGAMRYLEDMLRNAAGTDRYDATLVRFSFGEAVIRQRQLLGF